MFFVRLCTCVHACVCVRACVRASVCIVCVHSIRGVSAAAGLTPVARVAGMVNGRESAIGTCNHPLRLLLSRLQWPLDIITYDS